MTNYYCTQMLHDTSWIFTQDPGTCTESCALVKLFYEPKKPKPGKLMEPGYRHCHFFLTEVIVQKIQDTILQDKNS